MKALVVLSGGMDSATALAITVNEYGAKNVETVTFNYNSKHNAKENAAAAILAAKYKVKNTLIELPFIDKLFKSDLLSSGGEVPEGHYAEDNMKKTVVPFRNGIMLSIAAGLAESVGAQVLVIGNHAGDHAVYPDCREGFMAAFDLAVGMGTWSKVAIKRPFENYSKGDIAKLGIALGVPYSLTWSCYKGGKIHCGKCGTCVERLDAFREANIIDPVEYEDHESYKDVIKRGPQAAVASL